MICIEEQKENIARLNKIQSAAQVDAVIGIFQFFGQGWRLAAGVEFDSDEWEIADYPQDLRTIPDALTPNPSP